MADFRLKEYQQQALDKLRSYFRLAAQFDSADTAFYHLTRRSYTSVRELPGLPYVCLRLPTGAGKTLVACHALPIAVRELLQAERSLVLWLVPSNAIREQTLKALRDRQHPYRRALDSLLGNVTVMDVSEALYISRPTLDTASAVIVSTIQAFRVEDTEGRKVYEPSGALMDHFSGFDPQALAGLERYEHGPVKTSLANVLRLRKPIVIVDEAHNARTQLSFDTLARFDPACIIELTATPDTETSPSNVLHIITAAELKAEDMVKLPIVLETHPYWKELLADAVNRRADLEIQAQSEKQATGEYLRPILLLQAQPRRHDRDTLSVEVVEACLRTDFRIPREQIARATGDDRDLDGVDILDPACPIRFIITVQALKEGWDCPFAYVLCSVAELHSPTAVEQILGRVMRLPNARRKTQADLNQAYAFVASASFLETADKLKDGLVQNGFERIEAENLVRRLPQPTLDFGPLFQQAAETPLHLTLKVGEALDLASLPAPTAAKLGPDAGGVYVITQPLTAGDRSALREVLHWDESRAAIEQVYWQSQRLGEGRSPAEQGIPFSIPLLAFQQGGMLRQFEESHFLERSWRLSQKDPILAETDYSLRRPQGQQARIDVTKEQRLQIEFIANLQEQMRLLAADQDWSEARLIHWLDSTIPHHDITQAESGAFIARLIRHLVDERGITLEQLVYDKFRLRQAVARKIDGHRQMERTQAYQRALFGDASPVVVTADACFTYDPDRYPCAPYQGSRPFHKHYYSLIGAFENLEEEHCAALIDSLDEVVVWVRNPERSSKAFWLQTSTDKFYPDFVCKLRDGRFLVVEYKGAHLWDTHDSREKRTLGELWEERSHGQCLFVMPRGPDFEAIRAAIARP